VNRAEHVTGIRAKYHGLQAFLNERTRRVWAGSEARAIGRGGIAIVAEAITMDRNTIVAGLQELLEKCASVPPERIRRTGGGRKMLIFTDITLQKDLEEDVAPHERGDPESSLRWTSKSTVHIADDLKTRGHIVSQPSVYRLLRKSGYSLQSNRKRREGTDHPDRDAQFIFINESVKKQQEKNQPCISVDTKKKENIGNYKNNGQEWSKKGKPVEVNMHDFPNKELGKAIPYGVYDLIENKGWVNVGVDHDTAQFAVASIRRWWQNMGRERYPHARELLITADSGGSNSARSRLWKVELQKLADETSLTIYVRHFPRGTSKWNKIEHRLFSMITKNWRGKPLDSLATIVNLIGSTKTKTGMLVKALLDDGTYEKGIKVSDVALAAVHLLRDAFHGDWNYSIVPR
jgi:hypothetical protein